MIKNKLIFLCKDKTNNQFGDRTIALEVDNAVWQVLGQLFKDISQYDVYTRPYIVNIDRSGVRPIAYHPIPTIQTPDQNNGIRYVYSEKEDDRKYESMPANGLMTYAKLGLSELTETVGFVTYSDRTEFWNLPISVTKVREMIVVPFSELADTDDFPLPSGVAETIVQMVCDSLKSNPIQDNIYKPKK
jgi:hypothetical protein